MATIELPSGMAGAACRASVKSARAFAFSVQSQCFSVSSAIGLITPVAAFETRTFSAPGGLDDLARVVGIPEVAAQDERLGAGGADLLGGGLGGLVVSQVADRDLARAAGREAQRDRTADAARTAGDEDVRALEAHGWSGAGVAGALLGRLDQPSARLAARAGPPRPSRTRGRGGRGARSSPPRRRASDGPAGGRRRAPSRGRGSGRRSAASPALRGSRCRPWSARPWARLYRPI